MNQPYWDLLNQAIQREAVNLENAQHAHNWRDAEIADYRRLALLALFDEFVAASRSAVYIPADPNALDQSPKLDIAEIYDIASHTTLPNIILDPAEAMRLIECLRECAMEAEIGHELGGFRVTLLARHGFTDRSDPAFGPVKYENQSKIPDLPLF